MEVKKRRQVLSSALDAFFKYGFKRLSMKEIAELADVSRAGLYMDFKDKEALLNAAILHYAEVLIEEIEEGLKNKKTTEDKILFAFEVWSIRSFEQYMTSPEAKEIIEGYLSFARESFDASYKRLESLIASLIRAHFRDDDSKKVLSADRTAHLLVSASRGFKLVAKTGVELRRMLHDQLRLDLGIARKTSE